MFNLFLLFLLFFSSSFNGIFIGFVTKLPVLERKLNDLPDNNWWYWFPILTLYFLALYLFAYDEYDLLPLLSKLFVFDLTLLLFMFVLYLEASYAFFFSFWLLITISSLSVFCLSE